MADDVSVTPSDLDTDATTWRDWSDSLTSIADAVPLVGTDLTVLDFSVLPGAQAVMAAYSTAASALESVLRDGAESMTGMADKLVEVSNVYEQADQDTLAEIEAALSEQLEGN